MKKRISLFLVGVMSFSICFTGCGDEKGSDSTFKNVKESTSESKPTETTSSLPAVENITPEPEVVEEPEIDLSTRDYVVAIDAFIQGAFTHDGPLAMSAFPQEAVESFYLKGTDATYEEFTAAMSENWEGEIEENYTYTVKSEEPLDSDALTTYQNYLSTLMVSPSVTEGYHVVIVPEASNDDEIDVYLVDGSWTVDFTLITGANLEDYVEGTFSIEEDTIESLAAVNGDFDNVDTEIASILESNPQYENITFNIDGNELTYTYSISEGYVINDQTVNPDIDTQATSFVDNLENYYGIRPTVYYYFYLSDGTLGYSRVYN